MANPGGSAMGILAWWGGLEDKDKTRAQEAGTGEEQELKGPRRGKCECAHGCVLPALHRLVNLGRRAATAGSFS